MSCVYWRDDNKVVMMLTTLAADAIEWKLVPICFATVLPKGHETDMFCFGRNHNTKRLRLWPPQPRKRKLAPLRAQACFGLGFEDIIKCIEEGLDISY